MTRLDGSGQFLQLSADLAQGRANDGRHFQRSLQLDGVRVPAVVIVLIAFSELLLLLLLEVGQAAGHIGRQRRLRLHQERRAERHERQHLLLLRNKRRRDAATAQRCVHQQTTAARIESRR